ncbi:MAG: cytochrome c, partial [Pirellulaceae bacterium]|nr:cytochrome c [Pirellulaceae bacterium]
EFLHETGAVNIETCTRPLGEQSIPSMIKLGFIALALIALILPLTILQARYTTYDYPRIHPIPDMDFQSKFKSQTESRFLFADRRIMRPLIPGTVARGELVEDMELATGITGATIEDATSYEIIEGTEPDWLNHFPVEVTPELMARGQQQYNIYCVACHGASGDGLGLVHQRALGLKNMEKKPSSLDSGKTIETIWTNPPKYTDEKILTQPLGKLYNTITNGQAKMPGYRAQISTEDRWAVVLYVKALQRSQLGATDSGTPSQSQHSTDH